MSNPRKFQLSWLAVLAITVAFAALGATHAQAQNATVLGHTTDASGAAVPGVTVTVTNQDSGVARTISTGTDGTYLVLDLLPGKYTIKYEKAGFAELVVKDLELQVNQQVNRADKLALASTSQTVEVTGVAPPVDTTDSEVAGVVTDEQIENLPITNRQYLNLAELEPGTTQNGSRSFYNNVQIGGSDYYYTNSFLVDGVNNNWAEMGEPRQNFPEGSIEEFKVYTNQFKANEGGMAMGGAVSIVTKGGTNAWHGEAFEYFRNQALAVENRFQKLAQTQSGQANVAPPLRRNEYGVDLGGPIIKNKLHFYVSDEQQQQTISYTIYESAAAAATEYANFLGVYPEPSHDDMLTGRMDWQINNNQQLFVRYGQEWNLATCNGCGTHTFGSGGTYDGQFPRVSVVVGHTWMLSNNVVNDFRFQGARAEYLLAPTGCPSACGANIWTVFGSYPAARLEHIATTLSFPNFSWGASYADNGDEKHFEFADNMSILKGSHHIQLGYDEQEIPYTDELLIGVNGSYSFSTDPSIMPLLQKDAPVNGGAPGPSFSAANLYVGGYGPSSFSQSLPPVDTKEPTAEITLYAQDDWQATHNVSLSMGLRWDKEINAMDENVDPKTYLGYEQTNFPLIFCPGGTCALQPIPGMGTPNQRGYSKNFAPRLGATWDVRGNGKDVVRAGFGMYYNNILTLQNYSEIRDLEQYTAGLPIPGVQGSCSAPGPNGQIPNSKGQDPNPSCPGYPSPFVNGQYNTTNAAQFAGGSVPSGLVVLPQNFRNPYSEQYNVGYSREFSPNFSVHFDGIHTNSYRDYQGYDINIPSVYLGARPNTDFGTISERFPTSQSHYNAFDVRVDKRMTHNFQFLVSYTLSECKDNSPEGGITNYQNYDQQFGDCSIDQRNALTASVTWHAPLGVTVGVIQTNRSSQPFGVPSYTGGPNTATLVADNGGTAYPYKNNDGSSLPLQGMHRDQGARDLNYTLMNAYVTSGPGVEPTISALAAACGESSTNGSVTAPNALSYTPQCALKSLNPIAAVSPSTLTERRLNETDIRIARDFKFGEKRSLSLIAQVFNVFGVYNYTGVGTSPTGFASSTPVSAGSSFLSSYVQSWGTATGSNPLQFGEVAAKITF